MYDELLLAQIMNHLYKLLELQILDFILFPFSFLLFFSIYFQFSILGTRIKI